MKCPYCDKDAKLVDGDAIYPHRTDLHHLKFYQCKPCGAYVGCHKPGARVFIGDKKVVSDGTIPLGRLANATLRVLKVRVHAAFDPIWQNDAIWRDHEAHSGGTNPWSRRRQAYAWLAAKMYMFKDECHIGMFDEEKCERAIQICEASMINVRGRQRAKQKSEANQ